MFRFALGVAFAWQFVSALLSNRVALDYIQPSMHFTYLGFDWVRPFSGIGMYLEFFALTIAGLGVALGACYRVSAMVLFVGFAHVFLIERTLYNNHYYLMLLLAFLANLIPLNRDWSFDAYCDSKPVDPTLPLWSLLLLRFQIGVVYVFGGLAKLDFDWLQGQPMRMWLAAKSRLPVVGAWLASEEVAPIFSWGGLLIDLLAIPCLLWNRTRTPMFFLLVVFHAINSVLFTIGVFPWLMIAATTIYFPPDWPRRLLGRSIVSPHESVDERRRWTTLGILTAALIGVYVSLQVLLPFRPYLYPGNPAWTERGQLFAWRMMLRQKKTAIQFVGTDPRNDRQGVIDIRPYLNQRQATIMSRDPELILSFAHRLAERCRQLGIPGAEIRVKALVSLNGRKPQLLIDPFVDLAKQRRGWRSDPWVMPLVEPLRHRAWDVPPEKWKFSFASSRPLPVTPDAEQKQAADEKTPTIAPTLRLDHPAAGDQDDLCFWHDAAEPARSLIITSDKKNNLIAIYDAAGKLLQSHPVPKPGNIDIRQGVKGDGVARDLVVVNQRTEGWKLAVFEVDRQMRRLQRLDRGELTTGPNYGGCLYHSRTSGRLHAVITSETGKTEQYELSVSAAGQPTIRLVRRWEIGKSEGAVADDERGKLLIAEEERGVWELGAEPDQPTPGELAIRLGENGLKPDLEGITLVRRGDTDGFVLLSSQGSNRFFVYRRAGDHSFVGTFAIEGAAETDGIDFLALPFGVDFSQGVFGCHSALGRRSILLTPWHKIADQLRLSPQ